jgi:hypothetical protein
MRRFSWREKSFRSILPSVVWIVLCRPNSMVMQTQRVDNNAEAVRVDRDGRASH